MGEIVDLLMYRRKLEAQKCFKDFCNLENSLESLAQKFLGRGIMTKDVLVKSYALFLSKLIAHFDPNMNTGLRESIHEYIDKKVDEELIRKWESATDYTEG